MDFLGDLMTPKGLFEINRPLGGVVALFNWLCACPNCATLAPLFRSRDFSANSIELPKLKNGFASFLKEHSHQIIKNVPSEKI